MQHTQAHADDAAGWPTTLRFSRRMGEAMRGPEYAMAIEGPPARRPFIAPWTQRALKVLVLGSLASVDQHGRTS
jgi:hypothetical protein